MVKILRYIDRKIDKRSGFSIAEHGDEDIKEKNDKRNSVRILQRTKLINY